MRIDYATALKQRLIALVRRTPPGHNITIDRRDLADIGVLQLDGRWTPADTIMENIVGGAYEWFYRENPASGDVTFCRLATPLPPDGPLTYVSPDRRTYYTYDGIYYRLKVPPMARGE